MSSKAQSEELVFKKQTKQAEDNPFGNSQIYGKWC